MDWTKAKNILIIALVVTNALLIMLILFKEQEYPNPDKDALIDYLRSKNIVIKMEIPPKQKKMAVLAVKYDKLRDSTLQENLKKQKPSLKKDLTDEDYIKIAGDFCEECGIMNNSMVFDTLTKKKDVVTVSYKNVYEGVLIDDSFVRCNIQDGRVTSLERYWLEPIHFEKMKKDPISAGAALMKFSSMHNNDEKIYVESMELVYWIDPDSFNTESVIQDTVLPAWKITYNGDHVDHIPAFK